MHERTTGSIDVVTGPMFSGKSEELIRRAKRALIAKRRIQVFKSALDDRYSGRQFLTSHDGQTVSAVPVREAEAILPLVGADTHTVIIDEAQFFGDEIGDVALVLAGRGTNVVLAGTDTDFRGEPFGPMGRLLAISDNVIKLSAVCVCCGRPATRNQRLIDGRPVPADAPTIHVAAAESYEARCRSCHVVLSSKPLAGSVTAGSCATSPRG